MHPAAGWVVGVCRFVGDVNARGVSVRSAVAFSPSRSDRFAVPRLALAVLDWPSLSSKSSSAYRTTSGPTRRTNTGIVSPTPNWILGDSGRRMFQIDLLPRLKPRESTAQSQQQQQRQTPPDRVSARGHRHPPRLPRRTGRARERERAVQSRRGLQDAAGPLRSLWPTTTAVGSTRLPARFDRGGQRVGYAV